MRCFLRLFLCAAFIFPACTRSDERRFTLNGQIETLDPPVKNLVVKHDEIKGFMPAMTMPYEVAEAGILTGLRPGDRVRGTLRVDSRGYMITSLQKA